ncbi:hypothetical protein F4678DRAFT_454838 [Xylaria arbuscula]|nr:hypothetical protein F4678DRAFT_454838 [Xylaria arbuscula]
MALTIDRLALLNNDYLSASESSDEPELSHVDRLQRAKESVYACLRSIHSLGRDGRRIVGDDELRIAARNDVRFRDINRHAQDASNLEFWENKAQSLKDCFRRLHAKLHPPTTPRTVIAPAERTRKLVETWAFSVDNPPSPSRHSSDSLSHREHPPADPPRIETDFLPPSASSAPAPVPESHDGKRTKRKRSRTNCDIGSQRPTKRIHLLAGVEATQASSCNNVPVPRRSARIVALPKIKYSR